MLNFTFGVAGSGSDLIPDGDWQPSYVNVKSGSYAAWAAVAQGEGEHLSISQSIDLPQGTYTMGFFLGLDQATPVSIGSAILNNRLGIYVDG